MNMSTVLTVLQATAALATVVLCVFVIFAAVRLQKLARALDDSGKEFIENIAALSRMAREREIPLKAAGSIEDLARAGQNVATWAETWADKGSSVMSRMDDWLADENTASLPAEARELLAQGKELVENLNETCESLRSVVSAPVETVSRVSDTVLPLVEDARQKVEQMRWFLDAIKTGFSVGWEELHKPDENEESDTRDGESSPTGD
ncbi:hypothetical protein J7J84_00040 [bacterium]|nr:hypothetical protein [bacterium]